MTTQDELSKSVKQVVTGYYKVKFIGEKFY